MAAWSIEEQFRELEVHFPFWEMLKDMIDQSIDFMLNLRQSGHPGGSRSKVHIMLTLLLSGAMRWDIRNPQQPFSDRFILVAGHTNPLVYATLAVLNEALRKKYAKTGDKKYLVPDAEHRQLVLEDLLHLRRHHGLPGHAEMEGKTMFFKFNTGPSGHGSPAAAGQALALKMAGADQVRVFAMEGEGGMTAGAIHETMNSAWGLGLDNLHYLVDWNNFGIDNIPIDTVVYGTPKDWFGAHGWRVVGTEQGMEWPEVTRTMLESVFGNKPKNVPNAAFFKTRKGRGYGVYDNKSHGLPHAPMNSEQFWQTKKPFMEAYGLGFLGFGLPAPGSSEEKTEQTRANLQTVMSLYDLHPDLLDYTADRLVELARMIPDLRSKISIDCSTDISKDPEITDFSKYPAEMFVKPGEKAANRNALAKFGAYVNTVAKRKYGRPLFIVMSADLAESTNIAGFAKDWGEIKGFGVYNRDANLTGALLPQEITEFTNAGICAGMASTNLAANPFEKYCGFFAACSTYGSFSYLKYGPMRLFSQLTQDSQIKCGKVLWIAGHSGPETAEDSRTHFGIFAPGVTELFPKGQIINLYPWEHNEVPILLAAALQTDVHLIALHLTRPAIEVPDRADLGIASHFEAAKGAYLIRDYDPALPKMGAIFVQGTSTTVNAVKILPRLQEAKLNVKLIAAVSHELFYLQPSEYRHTLISEADWVDSTFITNGARRNMHNWIAHQFSEDYAMSSDWDNRWRTGGTVEEVVEEAHLSPEWLFKGIEKFVREREKRLGRLQKAIGAAISF
jgi:transketolase